jgi:outer membrane protein
MLKNSQPIFILCFLVWVFSAKAQKLLTLEECVQISLKQNPEIALNQLYIRQANDAHKFSKQNILPSITANVSQNLFGGRSIDPFTNSFVQRNISSNSFNMGANFTVFNGFALKNQIEQNRLQTEIAKQNLNLQKKILEISTIQAYLQVLLAIDFQKINQEQKQDIAEQLSIMKEKVKEGMVSPIQIKELEAQNANLKFEEFEIINNIKLAKLNLTQIMAYKDLTDFELKKPSLLLSPSKNTSVNHPIQKSLRLKLAESNIGIATAKGTAYPRLSMGLGAGTAFSSAAASEIAFFNQLNFNLNQFFNFGVSIPVFNSSQTKQKTAQAVVKSEIIKKEIEKENLKLNQEAETYRLEISVLKEKKNQALANLQIQSELYESVKERFKEGVLSTLELNTYRINLEKAKATHVKTELELIFKVLVLNAFLEE